MSINHVLASGGLNPTRINKGHKVPILDLDSSRLDTQNHHQLDFRGWIISELFHDRPVFALGRYAVYKKICQVNGRDAYAFLYFKNGFDSIGEMIHSEYVQNQTTFYNGLEYLIMLHKSDLIWEEVKETYPYRPEYHGRKEWGKEIGHPRDGWTVWVGNHGYGYFKARNGKLIDKQNKKKSISVRTALFDLRKNFYVPYSENYPKKCYGNMVKGLIENDLEKQRV